MTHNLELTPRQEGSEGLECVKMLANSCSQLDRWADSKVDQDAVLCHTLVALNDLSTAACRKALSAMLTIGVAGSKWIMQGVGSCRAHTHVSPTAQGKGSLIQQ